MNEAAKNRTDKAIRKWKASKRGDPIESTGEVPVIYTDEQLHQYLTDGTDSEVVDLQETSFPELNIFGPVNLQEVSNRIHKQLQFEPAKYFKDR